MKIKCLVKSMTKAELDNYIKNHPEWRIPTGAEAMDMEGTNLDWPVFRVDEMIADRELIYNKKYQCFNITHPAFRQQVVLIESNNTKEET